MYGNRKKEDDGKKNNQEKGYHEAQSSPKAQDYREA